MCDGSVPGGAGPGVARRPFSRYLALRSVAVMVAAALAATFALSCSRPGPFAAQPTEAGGLADGWVYSRHALDDLGPVAVFPTTAAEPRLLAGDLLGNREREVAIRDGERVRLFTSAGAEVEGFELPRADVRLGLAADVNGDGKEDLILGGRSAASGYVAAVDGKGQGLWEVSFEPMVNGTTRPALYANGQVLFTAASDLAVAPKVVGCVDARSGDLAWLYHMGPLPTGLSRGHAGILAVSNRALGKERRQVSTPYATAYDRHGILLLGGDGTQRLYTAVGAVPREGHFQADAISAVQTKLFDIDDDGRDEILLLTERVSELYGGSSTFEILTPEGTALREIAGPPRTDGTFGFYRARGEARIVLTWSRTGECLILDGELNTVHATRVGYEPYAAVVHQIGDFDGDGRAEFLLSDHAHVYILSDGLQTLFRWVFPAPVEDVVAFPGPDGVCQLAVLAGGLRLIAPTGSAVGCLEVYTQPAGARVFLDGAEIASAELPILEGLPAGRHRIVARMEDRSSEEMTVRVVPGRTERVVLSLEPTAVEDPPKVANPSYTPAAGAAGVVRQPRVPLQGYGDFGVRRADQIEPGFALAAVEDLLGEDGPELLFLNRQGTEYRVYGPDLGLLRAGRMPYPWHSFYVYGDLTGDGKAEFGGGRSHPVPALYAITAEGRMVMDKAFTPGFDTNMNYLGRLDDLLVASITTGYLLAPRGVYGFRAGSWEIEFFHPTAGMVNRMVGLGDRLYLDYYTANNGAVLTHPDGYVENDSEIYFHAIDTRGLALGSSGPLEGDQKDGGAVPFLFDTDADGKPEPYYMLNKDQYYQGTAGILRLGEDGSVVRVHDGPVNTATDFWEVLMDGTGRQVLSVIWRTGLHELLDGGFRVLRSHRYGPDDRLVGMMDLDGDGEWETLESVGGVFRALNADREVLAVYALPGETSRGVALHELDREGKMDLILYGDRTIQVLAY